MSSLAFFKDIYQSKQTKFPQTDALIAEIMQNQNQPYHLAMMWLIFLFRCQIFLANIT
jgi:hypothetical protein